MLMPQTTVSYPRLDELAGSARSCGPLRVGVVYPCERSALEAALEAQDQSFIEPVLIGPSARIRAAATEAGVGLAGIEIVEAADALAAARRAVALAGSGEIGALMKGSLHTDEML